MQISHDLKNRLLRLNSIPVAGRLLYFENRKTSPDSDFWRETAYQGEQGKLILRFLGVPLFNLYHSTSIQDVYATRDNPHLWEGLDQMIAQGLIEPLGPESQVLESGCNVGGNLRVMADKYNCKIYGLDISELAIEYARSEMFKDYPRAKFFCQDVLEYDFFDRFEDGFFSHTFCLSHLVHVPNGEAKRRYIRQLQRISRQVIFLERMPVERLGGDTRHTEDYEADYGFHLFKKFAKSNRKKWSGLYYWKADMPV